MKLAEALALRAEAMKRVEQLRSRVQANARFQEGEEPSEDAAALLSDADRALAELQELISRINRTNAVVTLDDGSTMTDALARRDVLRLRHSVWGQAADAASGRERFAGFRQLRSELRTLPALPVRDLRSTVDDLARQHRELDVAIQRANWEADLLD
jgi:hypothetical protein